jgi:hypothetical protein
MARTRRAFLPVAGSSIRLIQLPAEEIRLHPWPSDACDAGPSLSPWAQILQFSRERKFEVSDLFVDEAPLSANIEL